MYNEVLELSLPRRKKIVGFADDLVLLVISESREEVGVLITEATDPVEDGLREKKLSLVHHKTKHLSAAQYVRIVIDECTIDLKHFWK